MRWRTLCSDSARARDDDGVETVHSECWAGEAAVEATDFGGAGVTIDANDGFDGGDVVTTFPVAESIGLIVLPPACPSPLFFIAAPFSNMVSLPSPPRLRPSTASTTSTTLTEATGFIAACFCFFCRSTFDKMGGCVIGARGRVLGIWPGVVMMSSADGGISVRSMERRRSR